MSKKPTLAELAKRNREKESQDFKPGIAPTNTAKHVDDLGVFRYEWLPYELIDDNPFQPRETMDEQRMLDLIASINEQGQEQAIAVRRVGKRYQAVYGHRRKTAIGRGANARGLEAEDAATFVGLVLAKVYETLTDLQMLAKAIDENDEHDNVSALERGKSYKMLREMKSAEMVAQGKLEEGELISWRDLAAWRKRKYRQMHRDAQLLELGELAVTALKAKKLNARQGRGLALLLETAAEGRIDELATEAIRLRYTGDMVEKRAKTLIEQASTPPAIALPGADPAEEDAEAATASAEETREANRKALDEGRSHLTLLTTAKKPQQTEFAKREEDGRVVAVPVEAPDNGDEATGNARWAKAIVEGRLQPAALLVAGGRQSIEMGKWGPKERKKFLGALDALQQLIDDTRKAV